MTIERPTFPPRAESVDSFLPQPGVGEQQPEKRISESRKPADGLSRRIMLGALAVLPAALPAAAETSADPIFAIIARHRQAVAAHDAVIDVRAAFDDVNMNDEQKRQLAILEAAVDDAWDRLDDAGCVLVNSMPTTLTGVAALCRYVEPLLNEDTVNLPEVIYWVDKTASTAAGALANAIAAAVEVILRQGMQS